jgi:hypothetical protein
MMIKANSVVSVVIHVQETTRSENKGTRNIIPSTVEAKLFILQWLNGVESASIPQFHYIYTTKLLNEFRK